VVPSSFTKVEEFKLHAKNLATFIMPFKNGVDYADDLTAIYGQSRLKFRPFKAHGAIV
jgi:hypothetical protein